MKAYSTYLLLEWLRHPLTHPVVIEMVRAELARRNDPQCRSNTQ